MCAVRRPDPAIQTTDERWTYERYAQIPDDGERYEVIDGVLYVAPAPLPEHQDGVLGLGGPLREYALANDLGKVWVAPIDVVLPRGDIVQPDIVFVARTRMASVLQHDRLVGVPDLVVEVLSPSTAARDRAEKRDAYAAAGVPHYWMLAPRTRSLEAYELRGNAYASVGRWQGDQSFWPVLFPGLTIRIADLWR